jgi:hypothetical protein
MSVKIADVPTEIRTQHLVNTSLERYLYFSQLGSSGWGSTFPNLKIILPNVRKVLQENVWPPLAMFP